jgi:type II secretory pathway component PulC
MNEKKALRAGNTLIKKLQKMSNPDLMKMELGMMHLLKEIELELERRGLPRNVEL